MLHHIVWWTLKEEAEGHTAAENGAMLVEEGKKLMGKIEGLLSIELSTNIEATSTQEAHLVLHTTHPDAEALAHYANHPEHLAFGAVLKKCVSSRQALDFTV